MKIGILTQPLHLNYGGLLQAFALQKFLRDEGHDVLTVDYPRKAKAWSFPYRVARRVIGNFILKRGGTLSHESISSQEAGVHLTRFVRENIRTTKKIYAPARARDFAEYAFDAFVVGSDQTWRPAFSPYMPTFFLDFLGDDEKVRRVAYASSFGKDVWEFTPKMTEICSTLAKKFHAISVREDSGVALCKKYLGVSAEHLIDPTMLLEKADYEAIILQDEVRGFLRAPEKGRYVFAYLLSETEKNREIAKVCSKLHGTSILNGRAVVQPPVSEWLRGIRDSEFVVTDSFHGCVFSIVFNKPFVVIKNESGGVARIYSLLKMFGLESRLLSPNDVNENSFFPEKIDDFFKNPNWDEVNSRRSREQIRSRVFLENALSKF